MGHDARTMTQRILFGFHAVTVRLKTAPASITEIHVDATRRDARMRGFVERAREAGSRIIDSDDARLSKLAGNPRHQGVVARVEPLPPMHSLDEIIRSRRFRASRWRCTISTFSCDIARAVSRRLRSRRERLAPTGRRPQGPAPSRRSCPDARSCPF